MKKRKIFIGLVALEIISVPVSAQIIDHMLHVIPQNVISTELPRLPGVARIVVNSNTPFVIAASQVEGDVDVTINQSGSIKATQFGQSALMPGAAQACAKATGDNRSIIYAADQGTAKKRGEILSQSVIVEIRYAANADPIFDVMTRRDSQGLIEAAACTSTQT